jgi:hypothetical protein
MKRNLLGLFAVVLAIAISSFTVKRIVTIYLVYKPGASVQKQLSNYTQTLTLPGTVPGGAALNWFSIDDNNGSITSIEFNTRFDALDVTNAAGDDLLDESEIPNELDFK